MNKNEEYILHCAGFYHLLFWLEEQDKIGQKISIFNDIIYLSNLTSSFISIAISGKKKGKKPFLAFQYSTHIWLKNISWSHISIRENDNNLYLISEKVDGDYINYSDIPSFAIAISFDLLEKLSILKDCQKIDGRELFIDDDTPYINYHSRLFRVPILKLGKDEPILSDESIIDNNLLLRGKTANLESLYQNIVYNGNSY